MVGEFHHCQIALRDTGQQIGPSGNPQIGVSKPHQHRIVGKRMHQDSRNQLAGQEEQNGNQSAEAKHEVEKLLNGFPVAFSEILRSEDGSRRRTGHQEHVLYELDLRCQ